MQTSKHNQIITSTVSTKVDASTIAATFNTTSTETTSLEYLKNELFSAIKENNI